MIIERHAVDFDFRGRFPDARKVLAGELEVCYAASDGAESVLIIDSRAMAELLDEDPRDAITVRRFGTSADRDEFIATLIGRVSRPASSPAERS